MELKKKKKKKKKERKKEKEKKLLSVKSNSTELLKYASTIKIATLKLL